MTLPQPPPPKTNRRKKGLNHKAREITESTVLQELKDKERAAKCEKEERKLERGRKANERKLEKERKKLEQALEKAKEKERKANEKRDRKRKPRSTKCPTSPMANDLDLLLEIDDNDDTGQCSNCGMCFSDEDKFRVGCDKCDMWFCFDCHDFPTKDTLPDEFFVRNVYKIILRATVNCNVS